jgi:hypothetical protein
MNKKKKPEIDEKRMGMNPFITNISLKGRTFDKEEQIIIQVEEGMNIPSGTFKNKLVVEEQSCTKLWHDTDFRNIILLLSYNALRLFNYIQYTLKPNIDYIWINSRLFQDTCKINKKQEYIDAVEELIRFGVITTTIYPDTYWINPLIIFSGNRLKKYPENVIIR